MAAAGCAAAIAVLVHSSSRGDLTTTPFEPATQSVAVTASVEVPSTVPPLKDPTGLATEEDLGRLRFTDVSHTAGFRDPQSTLQLLDSESMSSGVAVGDVDGDGDEDVVLTRIGLLNQLMLNDGEGRFTDVGAQVGIGGAPGQQSSSATFGDIDNDGCLDLYLGGAGTTDSHLYRNDCAGASPTSRGPQGSRSPLESRKHLG